VKIGEGDARGKEGTAMSWPKRILIGLGIVLALLIAIVFAIGFWTPDENSVIQTMSMTVGDRTVTVGGHYKGMTQESLADGIKVMVDGHEITLSADQLTVDGKTQVLEPGQDVEILVDADGKVSVKLVNSDAAQ
jgi:autotransporter translocation and assembly factor TamB